MKKILFLTTFVVFIFIPTSVSADVVINEIMYDLEKGLDAGREWVEVFNNSNAPVDLAGWKFYENETNHRLTIIQGDIILPKNEHAIIADNPDKFLIDNPGYSGTLFDSAFSLKNDGESLALKNSNLVIIDEVTYDSSWGANGDGNSLQRRDPDGNSNEPANWGTGNPTPGTDNIIEELKEPEQEEPTEQEQPETPTIPTSNQPPIADAGDNIIGFIGQEIEFDGTKSSDPDEDELAYSWNMGDGKVIDKPSFTYKYSYPGTYLVTLTVSDGQDYALDTITIKVKPQQITINEFIPNPEGKDEENEWIEIYNGSDSIVDISKWQLDDIASGSKPFIFPENTLIAPKSYIVFSRQITGIALNNDRDSVRLLLPEGIVFQEINYEKPKQGQSSARTDEGFVWSVPTPGMANIVSPPTNMGLGEGEGFVYQKAIESETTKEPSQDYSWYFQSDFDKEIEGGYTFLPIKEQSKADDQFAAISNLAPQAKSNENQKAKQDILNLVLMIIAVILAGLIIGLFFTKLSKKFP